MNTSTINHIDEIKSRIPNDMFESIIEQAKQGDPDWLLDLCSEHNNGIQPDNTFYITDFHSYFNAYEKFDIDAIHESLIANL